MNPSRKHPSLNLAASRKQFAIGRTVSLVGIRAVMLVWLSVTAVRTAAQTPPVNDSFTNRTFLTGVSNYVSGDNTFATLEPGEPVPPSCNRSGKTVWWAFTAPQDGLLRVGAGGFSNAVAWGVFEGDSLAALSLVSASCSLGLWIPAVSNHTYNIVVDGAYAKAGGLVVQVVFDPRPTNDAFAHSVHLEGSPVSASGTTFGATVESGEPLVDPENYTTVWYSWAAPFTGRASIGGNLRRDFVYTGNSVTQLTAVRMVPDFLALEGHVYHLQIESVNDNGITVGAFNFTIYLTPFASGSNDHFSNAAGLAGTTPGDARGINDATLEPDEPVHRGGAPSKSLWWHWQAPQTASVSLRADPSIVPEVVFDVYTGQALRALTKVTNATNIVRFNVLAGRDYYLSTAVAEDALGDVSFYGSLSGVSQVAESISGNILLEPSFEGTALQFANWQAKPGYGGFVNQAGGADGRTWIALPSSGYLWQDVPTVVGRNYRFRFAFKGGNALQVLEGSQPLATVSSAGSYWQWTNLVFSATQTTSRIIFTNLGTAMQIDGCSLTWLNEAPSILAQPVSVSAFAGGSVVFDVAAAGSAPLCFQWLLNGSPLPEKTSATLFLQNLSITNGGSYSVIITNHSGAVTSSPATLTIEAPAAPSIVLQPFTDAVAQGSYFVFNAAAVGTGPLSYQWFQNDTAVQGATNSRLVFDFVQDTNEGTYLLRVTNYSGATWSLPAVLTVTNAPFGDGGVVLLANRFFGGGATNEVPIYDVDNQTRLSGGNYVAQLYAGPSTDSMRAVGSPTPFYTGFLQGFIQNKTVKIPTVPPFVEALVQVRAWESGKGASFEEARALGGKFGKSSIFSVVTGQAPGVPPFLLGLQSFHLQAGLPQFVSGIIHIEQGESPASVRLSVEGHPDSRYLIERSTNQFNWYPLKVITNVSGSVSFDDPAASAGQVLYRARLLD